MRRGRLRSYEKFSYLLRPSKQVERKLIIEALHKLVKGGLDIRSYTYLGLGSVYYADFILFHKYLYVDKMICVEAEEIPKRMRFNKPFSFIKLKMAKVSDILPTLSRTERYFVWLDYDSVLSDEILQDLAGSLHVLPEESILIVTVDADPEHVMELADHEDEQGADLVVLEKLRAQFEPYYEEQIDPRVLAYNNLPTFFAEVIRSKIMEEVSRKTGLKFHQLFNFRYADGAQMLSVGGVLGSAELGKKLKQSGVYDLGFITRGKTPKSIAVPPLTLGEKLWLERHLARIGLKDPAFELEPKMLENFKTYYRYYPTYYETLL